MSFTVPARATGELRLAFPDGREMMRGGVYPLSLVGAVEWTCLDCGRPIVDGHCGCLWRSATRSARFYAWTGVGLACISGAIAGVVAWRHVYGWVAVLDGGMALLGAMLAGYNFAAAHLTGDR